jgi:hypothetical protein
VLSAARKPTSSALQRAETLGQRPQRPAAALAARRFPLHHGAAEASAAAATPSASMVALKVPLSPEELAAPKSKVCVTGAAGYIASYIVQRLLAAGHTGEGQE